MQGDKLAQAQHFFAAQKVTAATRALPDPPMEPKKEDSAFCYLCAEESIPAEAQDEMKKQRQYCIDMTGIAWNYIKDQVTKKKDPKLFYSGELWEEIVANMPLCAAPVVRREAKKETVAGIELATKFVLMLTGLATGVSAVAAFTSWLNSIKDAIQVGGSDAQRSYDFGSMSIYLNCQTSGGTPFVESYLKTTIINFKDSTQIVKSTCASAHMYSFDMEFKQITTLFNYGALRSGSDVKEEFDSFITGTALADIAKGKSFFPIKKKTS